MQRTNTVIIGGGQAGLAMSRCLSDRSVDHVILERGRLAERWRSERWDSLRLLTPNWQSRLPGWAYRGPDPDGFMSMSQVVDYFERFAASFGAPVRHETTVRAVWRGAFGYRVATDQGTWAADNVVVATGHCGAPLVPGLARAVSRDVVQIIPSRYRNPAQLPDGGVLVVGASASGVQIAEELRRAGRPVTLAVGRHARLPRRYRGRDVMWWLDRMGRFDLRTDDTGGARVVERPSTQLVGGRRDLDLRVLQAAGVRLAGRLVATEGTTVHFADDLERTTQIADDEARATLAQIDAFIAAHPDVGHRGPAHGVEPVHPGPGPARMDLGAEGITSVVWATGYRREYPWLRVPVSDRAGNILHRGGVTPSPGLYVLGLRDLRRRKSNFIDGVGADAAELTEHLVGRSLRRPVMATSAAKA
jgi:putative flavoprotein involved in K+ transport